MQGHHGVSRLVGVSPSIQAVRQQIERLAALPIPVLIQGETGTGKECVARALHEMGHRSRSPFVAINCSAIPATLMESELFGYRRGAFTGADADRPGLVEQAADGTLLFDEIGDMPLIQQAKILRLLQEKTFRRVGDDRFRKARCRFLFATHRPLEALIGTGEFRLDLFFRIRVSVIHLPPLRERPEDIPPLVFHFIERHRLAFGSPVTTVHADVWPLLRQYPWPGNVRELETAVQRALIEAGETLELRAAHFPLEIQAGIPPVGFDPLNGREHRWVLQVCGMQSLRKAREEMERQYVQRVLQEVSFNKSRASQILGISRTTLYNILNHGTIRKS